MLKIGILTSGGDCQALNAVMCSFVKTIASQKKGVRFYGFNNGYLGLLNKDYQVMKDTDFADILNMGGTILGSSRFSFKTITEEQFKKLEDNYRSLKLDCLVVLGGDGSQKTAARLSRDGLNIITLPKTIDNDIVGTDQTFGFFSAIDRAAGVINDLKTTAASHQRIFLVEIMGHKAGWLALYSGIATHADMILLPEIPYNVTSVINSINKKLASGRKYLMIVVAEGAKEKGVKEKPASSSTYLSERLKDSFKQEIRTVVAGHIQRAGAPSSYDCFISTRLGVEGARCALNKTYGVMVGIMDDHIRLVKLSEIAAKSRKVDPDSEIIKEARMLGIRFGDE